MKPRGGNGRANPKLLIMMHPSRHLLGSVFFSSGGVLLSGESHTPDIIWKACNADKKVMP